MGTMPHREDPDTTADDLDTYTEAVTGTPADAAHLPLDVRTVDTVRTEEVPARNIVTGSVPLSSNVVAQVLGTNRLRLSATIVYRGPDGSVAFIQGHNQLSTGSGAFQLNNGQHVNIQATGPVYAVTAATGGRFDFLVQNKDG